MKNKAFIYVAESSLTWKTSKPGNVREFCSYPKSQGVVKEFNKNLETLGNL